MPKYADFSSPTFAFDMEQNDYLGLLVTGTTMPEVWGKLTNNSPLLDEGYQTRPFTAGVLPGQSTMPSTTPDLGTVVATDFIPYISIKPTTYP